MKPSEMNEANRRYWDASALAWRELREQDQLWRKIPQQPALAFEGEALPMIERYAGLLAGKLACVIASGDNYVTFALAGMGAQVTSTDISGEQLAVASERAKELALTIEFIRAMPPGWRTSPITPLTWCVPRTAFSCGLPNQGRFFARCSGC
jgi:2-polyprenyl-3-methyl-5-hydroxy-6-metoxy-1,4-benzoquinol methylase